MHLIKYKRYSVEDLHSALQIWHLIDHKVRRAPSVPVLAAGFPGP